MIIHSATSDPLNAYNHDNVSPSSSLDRKPTPEIQTSTIPLPVLTRSASGASSMSYNSTTNLLPQGKKDDLPQTTARQSWLPWIRDRQRVHDSETHPHRGSGILEITASFDKKHYPWWHGWKKLLFDSCMHFLLLLHLIEEVTGRGLGINVLILLIPATVSLIH